MKLGSYIILCANNSPLWWKQNSTGQNICTTLMSGMLKQFETCQQYNEKMDKVLSRHYREEKMKRLQTHTLSTSLAVREVKLQFTMSQHCKTPGWQWLKVQHLMTRTENWAHGAYPQERTLSIKPVWKVLTTYPICHTCDYHQQQKCTLTCFRMQGQKCSE